MHKTQTGGQTLVEAKHINVSLFFLEMVIVALRERGTKGRRAPFLITHLWHAYLGALGLWWLEVPAVFPCCCPVKLAVSPHRNVKLHP